MKPVVKLNFSDFWGDFDPHDNWFVSTLKKRFEIEISDRPDFLIYSCYSTEFLKFNGIRIFYSGYTRRD